MTVIQPVGKPHQYETYRIIAPVKTHWRDATCSEAGCEGPKPCEMCTNGWKTIVDPSDKEGQKRLLYIRNHSGRTFKEQRDATGLHIFTFAPNQRCFLLQHEEHNHKVRLDRPFRNLIQGGDNRVMTTQPKEVHYAEWQERFEENRDKIATEHQKG